MIDDPIGKVIKSYELKGLVGTGGFGAVYRAQQAVVEREVAIKIIWPAFASHPNFIRRFETEAQLVAGLEHPHIVPLYDYWRDPDGAYIVMRYIRGGALDESLNGTPWQLREVNHLLGQVAAALAMAHRAGVVHRDIKPENILLDESGNAYLADFGIAQIISNAQEEEALLGGMGSPAYAAPEQIAGGDISVQSDLYSLGIILYELLTGAHPFPQLEQLSMTEMNELRASEPVPSLLIKRPDLPRTINDVIQRVTAINPQDRFPDALSLTRAFQEAAGRGRQMTGSRIKIPDSDEILPNPYKGLRPFEESDAANFFGRDVLVRRLLNRLKETDEFARFLAIVGPSGSGKSSVVKAGLIPKLRRGAMPGSANWFYDEVVPGGQPFQEIEQALVGVAVEPPQNLLARLRASERGLLEAVDEILPDDDSEFFLLIDQFEELFTLCDDEQVIAHFLSSLYTAVTAPDSRLRLVITIRADFYDRPLLQPRLSDLVRERTEVVVPLSTAELESVIVEPARRAGVMIDSGLVASIVAEVKEQPGALPLLQYSLSELFERREGNLITQQAYREIGGVRGALARRADEIYSELDPDEQLATRQLFLRLITLGEGTEDTRRRALLGEVTSIRDDDPATDDPQIMRRVIDKLGDARLLTFDRDPVTRSPTVEVTHEAIIREWSRLRTWLDESRNDVRMQRGLSQLAQEWNNNARDTSYLLRGVRLDSYEKWAESTSLALTGQERNYLKRSLDERRRREAAERARQERERLLEQQSINRLRLLAIVLLLATVGALALTGFALNESRRASQNAAFSQSIAWEAGARRALSDHDTDLALLLALQANELDNPPVQSQSTLAEVAFAPGTRTVIDAHSARVNAVDISADGHVASGSTDATVRLSDADGNLLHVLDGHSGDVLAVAFSPDGTRLVSAGADFTAILWDVAAGSEIRRFEGHQLPIQTVLFTPDGSGLVTGGSDSALILWDVAGGSEIRRFEGHNTSVVSSAISPDGATLLSGSRDGTMYSWNVADARLRGEFSGHDTAINSIDFRSDGDFAVSAAADGDMILWDMSLGLRERRFVGTSEEIRSVAFSPDNRYVYSGAINGLVQIWDSETGLEANRLRGHDDGVLSIAISPDGDLAASGSLDDTVRLWNIGNPAAVRTLADHRSRVSRVSFSEDGSRIVTSSVDDTLLIRDVASGVVQHRIPFEDNPLLSMALSPDGERALVGSRDGFMVEVDLNTGETLQQFNGHEETVEALMYLPDGNRAISGGLDEQVILWDVTNGSEIRRFDGHENGVYALALHPNSTQFVSASSDRQAILWDIDTGNEIRRFEGHDGAIYAAAFSPDGSYLATGGRDEQILVWNPDSGREVAQFVGDSDIIWSLAFSADSNRLLAGTGSGQALIWDMTATSLLQRLSIDSDVAIFDVAFAPDGQQAATAQQNGTVTLWRTFDTERIIEWAQNNRYVRDWTCLERERYRIMPLCDADTG